MNNVDLTIKFVNKVQEDFVYCNKRNQWFNGSFGNGKTFGAAIKALSLLGTFPFYKIGVSRYSAKELGQSTMNTFFKVIPSELYNDAYGGRRNDRDGYLRLINGSEIIWMHLDDYSEADLRGKEFNSVITDQLEEISEEIFNTLDARMERWDMVQIPPHLNPEMFPKNPFTGKPMPPCYNMGLFNPDTTLHWIYRRAHPDSPDVLRYAGNYENTEVHGEASSSTYYRDAAWFTASMADNPAIPQSLKDAYLKREQSWIDRFYWGKWGIAGGSIHYVQAASIIEFNNRDWKVAREKLLEIIKKDGIKYRVMDHGEAAPTCCLWFAYLAPSVLYSAFGCKSKGIHICYREYYQPGKIIKYHREAIAELSGGEKYAGNFADPAIFKKNQQKFGGFWTTADDYTDTRGWTETDKRKAPPISWIPADNNEYSCRDCITRLLQRDVETINPITGEMDAPSIYFLKQHTVEYPHGASHVLAQLQSARRKKVGNVNGEDVYSDERDDNVEDHAYDPLRYYAIMPKSLTLPDRPIDEPEFSFNKHMRVLRTRKFRTYRGVY